MRQSLLVVAAIAVVGSVWFVGAMPKQAQAQEAPVVVRTLPPVAPLEVKNSKLPAELVAAIKKFVGQGIPDVRGGELRTAKVAQIASYQGMPDRVDVIGWVMPADENGVQLVVNMFGSVYKAASAGEPITVEDAYSKSIDSDQYMGDMSRIMMDRSICKIVMLVIAGETEKADQYFEVMKSTGSPPGWGGNPGIGYETILGQLFYNSNYASMARLARDADWKNALTSSIRSKFCETNSTTGQGNAYYGYNPGRVRTDQIILDLERRIKENRPVPNILDIVGLEPEARRNALIQALDGAVKLDNQESHLTVGGLIIEEGEAIIPDLIEAYRTDDRVTFALSEGGFMNNAPQAVRTLIQRYISQLWVGMPNLPYTSLEGRYERTSDFWAARWKEHSKLSAGQRYLNSIADLKTSDRSASESLSGLFAKGTGGGTVSYTPGKVPVILDQLSGAERKKLGDALEKRIMRFGDPKDQNLDFNSIGQLCIGLAHIRGKDAVPALRQFSLEVLAKFSDGRDDSKWSQYGDALGAVISQRIALGDEKAAMVDYKAALADYSIKNVMNAEALRTGWEHPNNAAVQDLVASTLSKAVTKLRNEGGYEVSRSYLMLNNFHRDSWFGSLGIRRVVADMVSDNTALGTVKTSSRDSYVSAEFIYPNGRGSESYPKETKNLVVGKEMTLYAGDLSIMQIDNSLKDMKFVLATAEDARKSFRADFAKKLKDKGFNWKAHLENRYYGVSELPIYRP